MCKVCIDFDLNKLSLDDAWDIIDDKPELRSKDVVHSSDDIRTIVYSINQIEEVTKEWGKIKI